MVIVIIYLEEMYIKINTLRFFSQSNSMVNVFGDSIGEEGLGNLQVLIKWKVC